ncbi:MAG: hypothetical protein J6B16_02340, partial [Clostridia bacterium]|nr:hypothetical protein [Clostridia bacterium]
EVAENSWVIPALGEDSTSDETSELASDSNTESTTISGCVAGMGTASVAFGGLLLAVYTIIRKKRV